MNTRMAQGRRSVDGLSPAGIDWPAFLLAWHRIGCLVGDLVVRSVITPHSRTRIYWLGSRTGATPLSREGGDRDG